MPSRKLASKRVSYYRSTVIRLPLIAGVRTHHLLTGQALYVVAQHRRVYVADIVQDAGYNDGYMSAPLFSVTQILPQEPH